MSDETLIEAAPCPQCRSPLTVALEDLGQLVECPSCSNQFRARRKDAGSSTSPSRRDEPRPRWDSEDRDESRGRRGLGRGERDRDLDDDYDDRPRPRRRYEDDYDIDERGGPRRARPGSLTAIAVMNFVYCGLCFLCGVAQSIGLIFVKEVQVPGMPPPNMAIELGLMLTYWASAFVMLFAGIFVLKRKGYGLCVVGIGLACLLVVFAIANGVSNFGAMPRNAPGQDVGFVCGIGLVVMIWLGYIITNGILLAKGGRYFR